MITNKSFGARIAAACLLAFMTAYAMDVSAQPQVNPDKVSSKKKLHLPPVKPKPKTVTPKVLSSTAVQVAIQPIPVTGFAANGQRNQPTLHMDGDGAALSAFDLEFQDSDHKISRISLLRFPGVVQPALNDNDGNDLFMGSARYLDLGPANRVFSQSATCRISCDVALPSIGRDQTAVLAGFSFERSGSDNNIREIALRLDPARRIASASLIDDGGTEFVSESPGVASIGYDHAREFSVTVQYLLIDSARVKDRLRVSGMYMKERGRDYGTSGSVGPWVAVTGGQGAVTPGLALPGELQQGRLFDHSSLVIGTPPHALQGFQFRFTNSDHFLKKIGVNLARRDEIVSFQDNNGDDPYSWSVDYAVLKRPGE